MARKNKRKKKEYRDRLGFDPRKYISGGTACVTGRGNYLHPMYFPSRNPKRGDIWFADLGEHPGTSVQSGCRPVLIVSNDIGNLHAETMNVLPMTRHLKKPDLPCHTELQPEFITEAAQMLEPSMILAEQVTTISKYQLRNFVGKIADTDFLNRIDHALSAQLGMTEINHIDHSETREREGELI